MIKSFFSEKNLLKAEHLTGSELVDYINKAQKLFTLSPRFANFPDEIKRRLMDDSTIPKSFDSRTNWPECSSLYSIRDQSSCGSCWAVAAAEAMTDRICIASKGNLTVTISADDLLSCCDECGYGCDGGDPYEAWSYWVSSGIVTGTNFLLQSGCKPYPYPPCDDNFQKCPKDIYPTNTCEYKCQDDYSVSYNNDKHYGASVYAVAQDVASIQKEIMINGPVEVAFDVYEDFEHYSSGIYKHTTGDYLGGHAVKMLGWGTENGTDYWICANSWNSDWGENGFFRILRGVDECEIESGVVAGEPQ
ncbi:unnamed protein product [Angiostrongylus costaricensis]|uniref:Peptidase C1A papain C-terminal domain-containing protein n=1 Tax=Angiostrongylus costaricensis TaxID=334426 RepID=A0A3P7HKW2_ANGCS|nr:unnamed protein product [Angiostrongylus costaricensis]